jgi:hypothetical protein
LGLGVAPDDVTGSAVLVPLSHNEATLRHHEEAGTTDDPAYEEACLVFYARHLCRLDPWPAERIPVRAALRSPPDLGRRTRHVQHTIHTTFSIADYSLDGRLIVTIGPKLQISLTSGRCSLVTGLHTKSARFHRHSHRIA